MPRACTHGSRKGRIPLLEQVLPLLILHEYLSAEECLACFGTSRGIAQLVVQTARSTRLKLELDRAAAVVPSVWRWWEGRGGGGGGSSNGGGTSSGGGNSSSGGGNSCRSRNARASFKAAQQLAAQSRNVALTLSGHGPLLRPAPCLWQSITSMHLDVLELSHADFSSRGQLQLHRLPHLHTLSLYMCHMRAGEAPDDRGAERPLPLASSIRTIKCEYCTSSLRREVSPLPLILSLVDPGRLQTLITDDPADCHHISQVPGLQELVVTRGTAGAILDGTFEQLLQHPGLTRVTLPVVALDADYSDQPCRWASLKLTEGASVQLLAALPLASIQSCTIQGSLWNRGTAGSDTLLAKAVSNVTSCPHLTFEAVLQGELEQGEWEPAEPSFCLDTHHKTTDEAAHMVGMVARHLSGPALRLGKYNDMSREVIASLAAAPPTLTTLYLPMMTHDWDDVEVEAGALTHLPAHAGHVVLAAASEMLETEHWLNALGRYVLGFSRPLRLTLLHVCGVYKWPRSIKAGVRRWLSTHVSDQVRLEFQTGQFDGGPF